MKKAPNKMKWKYSEGGRAMFWMLTFLMLMLEMLHTFLRLDAGTNHVGRKIIFVLLEVIFGACGWFLGLRPLIVRGLWRFLRTWYEGFGILGLLFAFYGLMVAITGYSPSRYNSHPVPRSDSIYYFIFAAPFLTVAAIFFLLSKIREKP